MQMYGVKAGRKYNKVLTLGQEALGLDLDLDGGASAFDMGGFRTRSMQQSDTVACVKIAMGRQTRPLVRSGLHVRCMSPGQL